MGGHPLGHRGSGNQDFRGRVAQGRKNRETPNPDKDKTAVTRKGDVDHGLSLEG
jgi:hypothetical protein